MVGMIGASSASLRSALHVVEGRMIARFACSSEQCSACKNPIHNAEEEVMWIQKATVRIRNECLAIFLALFISMHDKGMMNLKWSTVLQDSGVPFTWKSYLQDCSLFTIVNCDAIKIISEKLYKPKPFRRRWLDSSCDMTEIDKPASSALKDLSCSWPLLGDQNCWIFSHLKEDPLKRMQCSSTSYLTALVQGQHRRG